MRQIQVGAEEQLGHVNASAEVRLKPVQVGTQQIVPIEHQMNRHDVTVEPVLEQMRLTAVDHAGHRLGQMLREPGACVLRVHTSTTPLLPMEVQQGRNGLASSLRADFAGRDPYRGDLALLLSSRMRGFGRQGRNELLYRPPRKFQTDRPPNRPPWPGPRVHKMSHCRRVRHLRKVDHVPPADLGEFASQVAGRLARIRVVDEDIREVGDSDAQRGEHGNSESTDSHQWRGGNELAGLPHQHNNQPAAPAVAEPPREQPGGRKEGGGGGAVVVQVVPLAREASQRRLVANYLCLPLAGVDAVEARSLLAFRA